MSVSRSDSDSRATTAAAGGFAVGRNRRTAERVPARSVVLRLACLISHFRFYLPRTGAFPSDHTPCGRCAWPNYLLVRQRHAPDHTLASISNSAARLSVSTGDRPQLI